MNTRSELRTLTVEEIDGVSGAEYKQLFKASIGDWSLVIFTDDGHLGAGLEHRVGDKTYTKTGTL
jgi:hypothetical protein